MRIVLEEKSWKRVISKLKDRDIQMFMVLSLLVGNNEKVALPLPDRVWGIPLASVPPGRSSSTRS